MFANWYDLNQYFAHQLARQMNALIDDQAASISMWPPCNMYENGESVILTAEVPGFAQDELNLSVVQDVLTLSGARKPVKPEESIVHRRERQAAVKFSRSFNLPYRVDTGKVEAELKDGVLTVMLPRHPEEQPRSIQIAKK
jgi:HSP20 family protein